MRLKDGVSVNGLKPECIIALSICNEVYKNYGIDMVITSGTEGKHSKNSLHYVGFAFDLRTNNIQYTSDVNLIVKDIKDALTDEYDIVLEKDHLHIEFQIKG